MSCSTLVRASFTRDMFSRMFDIPRRSFGTEKQTIIKHVQVLLHRSDDAALELKAASAIVNSKQPILFRTENGYFTLNRKQPTSF